MTPEQLWASLEPQVVVIEAKLERRERVQMGIIDPIYSDYGTSKKVGGSYQGAIMLIDECKPGMDITEIIEPCCDGDHYDEKEQHWPAPKRQAKPINTPKQHIRKRMRSVNRNR